MDVLRERDIQFIQPFLPLNDPKRLVDRLMEELAGEELSRQELAAAVEAAYLELERYKEDVRQYGAQILARVQKEHLPAVLLAGRPYHIDPEINHGSGQSG